MIPDELLPEYSAPDALRPKPKVPRTQMRTFMLRWLKEQGGICPLCRKPIDTTIKGEAVVDHDHDTGLIRGVLHRSCNAAEGKIANAAGRWGVGKMSYALIVPFLQNLVEYLQSPDKGYIYPTHLTEDEKRLKRNAKARQSRANSAAKQRLSRNSTRK